MIRINQLGNGHPIHIYGFGGYDGGAFSDGNGIGNGYGIEGGGDRELED